MKAQGQKRTHQLRFVGVQAFRYRRIRMEASPLCNKKRASLKDWHAFDLTLPT